MSAKFSIGSSGDFEREDLDRLSRELQRQLAETDGIKLGIAAQRLAPGERGDPVTAGTLLLAAVTSGAVTALFNILKSYVERGIDLNFEGTGPEGKPLKISMKGVKLTQFRSMLSDMGVIK